MITNPTKKRAFVAIVALGLIASPLSFYPASTHAQTTVVCTVGTSDLTIGSTGPSVTCLQRALIQAGYSIPAGATGYFGVQTRAAVAAWQAANGVAPTAGYFGPISRAKWAMTMAGTGSTGGTSTVPGCQPGYLFSPTTGQSCTGGTSAIPGCLPGYTFSSITGQPCSGTTGGTTDTGLRGGAGSVDEYQLLSSLANEEVGENENDVEVAGLEIEVNDGSDIEITAVRLVFDEGTAGSDFDKYATEVSLWLDGQEVARVDADEFTDRNNWARTISLDQGAIIRRGDTGVLTVAVSGARNIDSADLGDTWTVDFRQIRFRDANGASISEDPNTATRTFSFESFATARNVELRIREGENRINDSRTINVHATNDTDDVDVFSFEIEVRGGSDVELRSLPIEFTVTGAANLDDMVSLITLFVDGKRIARENVPTNDETVVFDDLDLVLRAGETYAFVVSVDFLPLSGTLDEGDTISATIGETETNSAFFDAEDESGEDIADADITGTATGGPHAVFEAGIEVTFVSATRSVNSNDGADNDTGTFVIRYRVTSTDQTIYVSDTTAATTAENITAATITGAGVLFLVDEAGVATTDDLSSLITWSRVSGTPTDSTNGVRLDAGETAEFTLTIVRVNDGDADDDGLYRAALKAIGWNTNDSTTWNVFDFNLEDFRTDPVHLN